MHPVDQIADDVLDVVPVGLDRLAGHVHHPVQIIVSDDPVHQQVVGRSTTVVVPIREDRVAVVGVVFVRTPQFQLTVVGRPQRIRRHGHPEGGRRRRHLRTAVVQHPERCEATIVGPSSFHHFALAAL